MLTLEQWRLFTYALRNSSLRDRALLAILYDCALRRSELGLLRIGHISNEHGIYVARKKKSRSGWYDIQKATRALLSEWLKEHFT